MKKKRIVVLGDLIYDCFIWADRLPRMGETVSGYASGFFSGGKGANQAVQAARLGAEVFLIGKVGDDERGAFLRAELEKDGVDVSHLMVSQEYSTATCCVHVDRNGNNAIIVAPMANEHITEAEIGACRELIESADVFMTQLQVNAEAVEAAVKIAAGAGVPVVLNPAPAREVPGELFKLADYVTPNETEAEFYTGIPAENGNLEKMARRMQEMGVRNLVITLGGRGAFYSTGEECGTVPPFSIRPVDATAAGDSFNVAFACAIAEGKSLPEAIRMGNAAGALTATRQGSQVSLPTAGEVAAFIKSQS